MKTHTEATLHFPAELVIFKKRKGGGGGAANCELLSFLWRCHYNMLILLSCRLHIPNAAIFNHYSNDICRVFQAYVEENVADPSVNGICIIRKWNVPSHKQLNVYCYIEVNLPIAIGASLVWHCLMWINPRSHIASTTSRINPLQ